MSRNMHLFLKVNAYFFSFILLFSCKTDDSIINLNGSEYPTDIGKLVLTKCTNPGCHNDISQEGAAGLSLSTWTNLFNGGRNGSVVIPHRPDFSTFCFYTNIYKDLGISLEPTMPFGSQPLSRTEYTILRDWVKNGAPNKNGNIMFTDNPRRAKLYVTNMLCDVVTVFDTKTMLAINYVDVGKTVNNEFPAMIKVAPDGDYWYVVFLTTGVMQKFNAIDDTYVGEINLGQGSWSTFEITPNSDKAFCVDNNSPGKIAYVDLVKMNVIANYTFGNNFTYPRGITINKSATMLYAGPQFGNFIYKIDVTNPLQPIIQEIPIDGSQTVLHNSTLDIHQIVLSKDESSYYVSCEKTKEVRVIQSSNDNLFTTINMGSAPQFMSLYKSENKLLISCPYDTLTFPETKGSIAVIDCETNTLLKKINTGVQPYGIGIDENKKIACVANGNTGSKSKEAHHVSNCGGKNGNVAFIDLTTLNLIPGKKSEVAVYPYFVGVRK